MGVVQDRCGQEGTRGKESRGEALHLPANLRSSPHLWSRIVGNDIKNEIFELSKMSFLRRVAGATSPQGEEHIHAEGVLSRTAVLPSH